jgi:hypothetical protein
MAGDATTDRRLSMNDAELNAIVEAKLEAELAARLQADRERVRAEVIMELRREAERAHYDRVNAKHPIEDKYGGLGPEGHAARLRAMAEGVRRDCAKMDAANAKPAPGAFVRGPRASMGGGEGFEIKR